MDKKLLKVKHGYGVIGLMFKTKINGLYEFRLGAIDKSLHTFFCFTDMDAICISPYGRVLQKLHMTPWKMYNCHSETVNVVEGEVGAFKDLNEGDLVEW